MLMEMIENCYHIRQDLSNHIIVSRSDHPREIEKKINYAKTLIVSLE